MGLTAAEIVLEYVCPGLGIVVGNIMFASPVRDCYNAVVAGRGLESLNATPWAFMLGSTFGWVTYGILTQNLFVFFGNAPGFLIAVWLNLQAVKLQYESFRLQEMQKAIVAALEQASEKLEDPLKSALLVPQEVVEQEQQAEQLYSAEPQYEMSALPPTTTPTPTEIQSLTDAAREVSAQNMVAPALHDYLVLGNVLVWLSVIALISYGSAFSSRTKELIVGIMANVNVVIFFGSPLSTIRTVLRTRSAATIHVPTMLTNTTNSVFWGAYGFAVMDPFISAPNSAGAALGVIQIIFYVIFPRNKDSGEVAPTDLDPERQDATTTTPAIEGSN